MKQFIVLMAVLPIMLIFLMQFTADQVLSLIHIFIVTALVGLFYWEHDGRIRWTTEEVASAAFDIAEGEEINEAMFKKMRVPPECIVDGALSMEEASKLKGRICRQNIKANSQIVADFFENTEELIEEGKSIFVIKPSWMDMRLSLIHILSGCSAVW